jgi:plasmid stabilization system protein ParE
MQTATYTLETWGEDQAVRYIDDMEEICQRLAENALLGRACDYIRPGLRRMESGRHVIFYRTHAYSQIGMGNGFQLLPYAKGKEAQASLISRTEQIFSLIKEQARLQTEYQRWKATNPGGEAMGLRIQIGAVHQQYLALLTPEEREQEPRFVLE